MSEQLRSLTPFNSPLETGLRALVLLAAAYPQGIDIQRLVEYDYLLVHSGDVGGPPSLHPPLPLRSGELLVRRELIERGLLLMISRGLVRRVARESGFYYEAEDGAGPFLDALITDYSVDLKERSEWVISAFGAIAEDELRRILNKAFDQWTTQFQVVEPPQQGEES